MQKYSVYLLKGIISLHNKLLTKKSESMNTNYDKNK